MYEQNIGTATPASARQTEASMVDLADRRLLVAWTEFGTSDWHDSGPAQIVGRTSTDGGRDWSDKFVLQKNVGRLNVMAASLLRLASGRIMLSFHRKDVEPLDLHHVAKFSDDEGASWTEPMQITRGEHYFCGCNDRLVQLRSGRILVPMGFVLLERPAAFCYYSDDDGASWRMSAKPVCDARGASEPVVVELKDDRLMMLLRNRSGRILKCYSEDGGEKWSGAQPLGPTSPAAPCQCKRLRTGDLLLVWNNHANTRLPLTTAVSTDEGETWTHYRNLEDWTGCPPEHTYCYPSILCVGDMVHLTYWDTFRPDADREQRLFHLKYRCLPVEWFYGK